MRKKKIITGFLGAGKTSLVNYLLKEKRSKRFAVVENEFGEVNIDRALVSDNLLEKEDLVSLDNGCMCCSLRKDIVKAFAEIEKRSCQRGCKVDAILLETTGLADPAPVAFTFFANPWMASRFKLDSILCVVDARHLLQHLEDPKPANAINEAVQQLAFSDLILLNKVDLVTEDQKRELKKAIRHINSTASLVECQLNDPDKCPPLDQLLGVGSFSVNRALEIDPTFLDSDSDFDSDHEASPSPSILASPPTPNLTSSAREINRQLRRRQHLQQAAEELETDRKLAAAASSSGQHASVSPQLAVPLIPFQRHTNRKRAAAIDISAVTSGQGTFLEPDESYHAGAHPQQPAHQSGQLQGSVERSQHVCDHAESCSCCPHPEDVLREGERRPKKPRKKLHDLSGVCSVGLTVPGLLDDYRFNMFMRDLLFEKAKDIFRCKGVLAVQGQGNQKFVFQGVHETICYGPAEQPWGDDEPKVNKIVFIGRGLDRKALVEGFRTCVWDQGVTA